MMNAIVEIIKGEKMSNEHFCTNCKYMELELKEPPCNRCNEFDEWVSEI